MEFLRGAARTYQRLYTQKDVSPREATVLERLSTQRNIASVLPLVIAIMDKVDDPDARHRLLDLIERLNFRFYGLPIARRADTGQGHLFWLARGFFAEWEDLASEEKLAAELRGFTRRHAPDLKVVQALIKAGCDVDKPNNLGITPLGIAARPGAMCTKPRTMASRRCIWLLNTGTSRWRRR